MNLNPEEPLIEAILAAPPDEAARKAYIDWLQRRGDPRGEYLRTEMTWAKVRWSEDELVLRAQARELDPVWVARVSRPPLGVCVDQVVMGRGAGDLPRLKVSNADLNWLENRFELTLPPDYRAFLLNYNGGLPEPGRLHIPGRDYADGEYDQLVMLLDISAAREAEIDNDGNLVWRLQFLDEVRTRPDLYKDETARWNGAPHRDLMVIGYGLPNGELEWFCLGCRNEVLGQVFFLVAPYLMSPDEEDYCLAAPSFAALLALLTDYEEAKAP